MKQRLTELKDEIDSSTMIVGVQYLTLNNGQNNWISTCQIRKLDPYFIPYTEIKSKWIMLLLLLSRISCV